MAIGSSRKSKKNRGKNVPPNAREQTKVVGIKSDEGWKQDPHNPQQPLDGVVENNPVVARQTSKRSVVDSEYLPLSHLIAHIYGDMWKADWYRQLVGLNDVLKPLALGTSAVEQTYELIKNVRLKVEEPLSPSQDTATKEFNVTGSGLLPQGIIPNQGDMFVADIGNGKAGLLTVTSTEKPAYTKESVYLCQWEIVDELTPEWETALEERVSKTIHFVPELIELYETPFMTESAYSSYVDLNEQMPRLIENFQETFWSREVQSIRVPEIEEILYDGFHARFCRNFHLSSVRYPIENFHLGIVDDEDIPTIWDVIESMDVYRLPRVMRKFGTESTGGMKGWHVQRTIRWTCYDYATVPIGTINEIDGPVTFSGSNLIVKGKDNGKGLVMLPKAMRERFQLPDKPLYNLIDFDSYVVSEAFYEQRREDMSIMENMLHRAVTGDVVPAEVVSTLCKEIYSEPPLSIYYYTPILMTLIHYAKRGGV